MLEVGVPGVPEVPGATQWVRALSASESCNEFTDIGVQVRPAGVPGGGELAAGAPGGGEAAAGVPGGGEVPEGRVHRQCEGSLMLCSARSMQPACMSVMLCRRRVQRAGPTSWGP